MVEIGIVCERGALVPRFATPGSSGADVSACLEENAILPPLGRATIPTGLFFDIPEGVEIQVRPRSGLAAKQGITVLNTPGTIDADYRGELKVILINLGEDSFVVENGMRIAQLVIAQVTQAVFVPVAAVSQTSRGAGGLGHTGIGVL